jgi:hypothetical protein
MQMTKPSTIVAVALAAGTFGGTIGALATAAIQSQASPEAIAAAIQRVSDSSAEQSLRGINAKVGTANTRLATLNSNLVGLNSNLVTLAHGLGVDAAGGALQGVARNLSRICQGTAAEPLVACVSVP